MEKIKVLKAETDISHQQGITSASNIPWTSPLHNNIRKNEGWRWLSGYHDLNAETIPDLSIYIFTSQ